MPKIVNHEEYRKELLDQSFEHFARQGYDITIRELAKGLNTSTGTLYYYFESKEDIFKQTMEYVSKKQVDIIIERLGNNRPAEEKVDLILKYILNNEKYFQNILFLIIDYYRQNDCNDPEQIIREMTDFYKQNLSEHLGISQSAVVSAFLSFILGILVHRILDPKTIDWQEQMALIRSLIGFFVDFKTKVA